ncbi:MAG: PspC domain-containing protein, partial [Victivallales bacterium]|nr:PspC domain-containing protein [Victivallales bacterium]
LGEYTPMPAWMWRALFIFSLFIGGAGIVAYIILWICMPVDEYF